VENLNYSTNPQPDVENFNFANMLKTYDRAKEFNLNNKQLLLTQTLKEPRNFISNLAISSKSQHPHPENILLQKLARRNQLAKSPNQCEHID
jgi:hypothetical protein